MGLTFAPLSESVMAAVTHSRQGQASGAYNAIRELGGVFGVAILGAVFQHIATTPASFMDGFHATTYVGAVIVLAGAVAAIVLPSKAHAAEAGQAMAVPAPQLVTEEVVA